MSASKGKDLLIRLIDDLRLDSSFESIIKSGIREATEDEASAMAMRLRGALERMPQLGETVRRSRPREVVRGSEFKVSEANVELKDQPQNVTLPVDDDTIWPRAIYKVLRAFLEQGLPALGMAWPPSIAIDFGSANTLIYVRGRGVVINEPSVAAVGYIGGLGGKMVVQAFGSAAMTMLARAPGSIRTVRPIKEGVIADFTVANQMLKHFIKMAHPWSFLAPSPVITICVPCGFTTLERSAFRESALGAGAREAYLIERPMAAAIGAGLPVEEAVGSMVVDIGGGSTEVGLISLGGIVYSGSVRVGGGKFDEAIINYIRRNYGMLIDETTAEEIKKEIGSAFLDSEIREKEVKGRTLAEGIPRSFTISSNEILEALTDPLNSIVSAVKSALEQAPPELGADIAEKGMVLTGGGALLHGIEQLLREETGLPVVIADDPLTCAVRGVGAAQRMTSLRSILITE